MNLKKKYYIAVDLEGVACVIGSYGKGLAGDAPDYAFACRQATREANAAAQALFNTGAEEVWVWDCHGTGYNLLHEELDRRVRIVLGAGSRKRFPGLDNSFAGVLFIGYHAYDTPDATLCHVYSSSAFQLQSVDGEPVGEMQIDAAVAGNVGVPVLFAAADNICIAQAKKTFPGIATVVTKTALAWNSCISKHPLAVCDEIAKAVLALPNGIVYTLPSPFTYEVRYKRIEYAQSCPYHSVDGTPFQRIDAYTCRGKLNKPEDIFT